MRFDEHLASIASACHLYANASNAFKDFLAWLAASSGRAEPIVLLPGYLPAKLYRAALAAGCRVRFYELHSDCRADLADVARKIDSEAIALFHVHYFGLAGEIEAMRAIANTRGLALIEDCALTVNATHDGRVLGTYGDVSLFSMRKVLLYPEGGALVVSERFRDFVPTYERRVRSTWSLSRFLLQRAKHGYVRATQGADPLGLVRPGPTGHISPREEQTLSVKRISEFTRSRLRFSDVDSVASRRRENFLYLAERLPQSPELEPLFAGLPEGCTPYSLPVLVRDGRRDELRRALLRDGVLPGAGWPESPFDPALTRTRQLAQSLLELPIHQAVTRRQLDRTLQCIARELRAHPAPAAREVTGLSASA